MLTRGHPPTPPENPDEPEGALLPVCLGRRHPVRRYSGQTEGNAEARGSGYPGIQGLHTEDPSIHYTQTDRFREPRCPMWASNHADFSNARPIQRTHVSRIPTPSGLRPQQNVL